MVKKPYMGVPCAVPVWVSWGAQAKERFSGFMDLWNYFIDINWVEI